MSSLMMDRGLGTSSPGAHVRTVGRAFTLTVLRRLDPERKALVVRFLAQASLIDSLPDSDDFGFPARGEVDLSGADLRNVPFRGAHFFGINLEGADLRGADFRDAFLVATSFEHANLLNADFRRASIDRLLRIPRPPATSFFDSCVTGARFAGALMAGVNFSALGWNVDFSNADLRKVKFTFAEITQAKFDGAKTKGADFPPDWTPTGQPVKSREAIRRCRSSVPLVMRPQ
jgi:uncharacterized protein YjbI with pentapeptide repeats